MLKTDFFLNKIYSSINIIFIYINIKYELL